MRRRNNMARLSTRGWKSKSTVQRPFPAVRRATRILERRFRFSNRQMSDMAERIPSASTCENPGSGTVCVYDVKTGRSGLKPARMLELASTVQYYYPGTQRIIVTEVRSRR